MRWLRVILITVIAAIVQSSFMGAMRVGGIVPNLILILIVCLALWGTASEAVLSAVLGGLILDTVGSGIFGLATSSLVVIALVIIALRQRGVDGHAWPTRLVMVALASGLWGVIHVMALGIGYLALWAAWRVIVLEILVNCCLSLAYHERWVYGSRKI